MGLQSNGKNSKENGDFNSKNIKNIKGESVELCFWNEYRVYRS